MIPHRSIMAVMLSLAATSASAQDLASLAAQTRKSFYDCAMSSVMGQISQQGLNYEADMNGVAEAAFMACATEEQAIRLVLAGARVSAQMVEAAIIRVKLDIKRELQEAKEMAKRAYRPR